MLNSLKRKVIGSGLAMLLLSAAVAQAALPTVLQQVPDDAAMVLVFKNLKQFTTKLANAGTRMKLQVPEDLLATLTGKFGVSEGLDQNGSAAVLYLDVGKDLPAGASQPPLIFIVPATDSKAMLKSLEAEAADAAGMMKVAMASGGVGYAAVAGKYVVLAEEKGTLAKFTSHTGTLDKKLSPESAAAFDANDLVLYANIPAFGPKSADAIDAAGEWMMRRMGTGNMDKITGAMGMEIGGAAFKLAKEFLSDSSAALVTFRLNDEGATLGTIGQFKADSPIGKFLAAQKPVHAANLDGLPDGKILFAGAGTWDKDTVGAVMIKIADQIMANPDVKESPRLADIKMAIDLEKQLIGGFGGEKMAVYEPADQSQGWMNAVIIADFDDPRKSLDVAVLVAKLNLGANTAQGLKVEQKVQENALTVQGVSLLKMTLTYSATDDAPPQVAAGLTAIRTLYGPDGLTMYYGVVGKQLVAVMGNDPKLLEAAIAAAQTGDTALSKHHEIVMANKAILPNSLSVAYMPVTNWLALAMKQFGMAPPEAPAGRAGPTPLVISAAATGPNMTVEMYVPMATLIDLSTTIQGSLGGIFH